MVEFDVADVFKAIALGCKRRIDWTSYIYGLTAGALGVAHVIRMLKEI